LFRRRPSRRPDDYVVIPGRECNERTRKVEMS
jgi:hypothetical protein